MQYCNVIVVSSDELACICVLKGIEFAPFFFYDVSFGFWNGSDSG